MIRRALCLLPALVLVLATAACDQLTPSFHLRDDYMGKRFLQPHRMPREVARDETGTPLIDESLFDSYFRNFRLLPYVPMDH
jgi:hypothetical protein